METLAITHHRRGPRSRLLLVNRFEPGAARARRRRSRPAGASTLGAVLIGCSSPGDAAWHTTFTERGIVFSRVMPACTVPDVVTANVEALV